MTSTELLSLLNSNPDLDGSTASELAAAIGCTAADLRPALRALVRDGELVTSGRTRGTRYSIVTAAPAIEVVDLTMHVHSMLRTPAAMSGGMRMEQICRIMGTTASETRDVVHQLVSAGVVSRTGNTRGTRYTAVSL